MAIRCLGRSFLNLHLSEHGKNFNASSISYQISRTYALKSALPIKWIRPEKVPCFKAPKSGDLEPLKDVDVKNLTPLEFKDCEELKTAPEEVKRLFTLEYFPYKKTVEYLRHEYVDLVKRHNLDYNSPEARVARMTVDIRDMQRYMETNPTNRRAKVRLKETIDKRKKLLKHLRTWDYKKFEWLLEELKLIYKPQPLRETYLRVERKRSLRMMTKSYCNNIINERLESYRQTLEDEQAKFLEDKIKKLEWIVKEELDCGAEPSVTQQDIDNVKLHLEQLKQKNSSQILEAK